MINLGSPACTPPSSLFHNQPIVTLMQNVKSILNNERARERGWMKMLTLCQIRQTMAARYL
jgi:hypothetical protein